MTRSHLLMRADDVCLVEVRPRGVRARLARAMDEGRLEGKVRDGDFAVSVPGPWKPLRPVFRGRLIEVHGGTLVELVVVPDVVVGLFVLACSLPLLGLPWWIAASAFAGEVPRALKALGETIGATAIGHAEVAATQPLADPEQPGAERGAPATLSPRVGAAEVTFSAEGWRLRVSRARLRIHPPTRRALAADWSELRSVEVVGTELVLGGARGAVRLPMTDVPDPHRQWLASYLEAAARRFGARELEAARQDEARRQLGQLREERDRR
ncbi:MAG: hypothetical protein H6738_23180 [Alphaproteobacteria bacterium]|nr:hypothetical protein [Alphaproteobacteria bacterium]MCB9699708.1 hypothetical protein [Alphaproteobacteria bacterium]